MVLYNLQVKLCPVMRPTADYDQAWGDSDSAQFQSCAEVTIMQGGMWGDN